MRAWFLLVLLAGCTGPAAAPTDEVPGDTEDETLATAPPATRVVALVQEVAWEGRTKEGFFVCSDQQGTGTCPAGQQIQPDGEHATTTPYMANLTRIDVNMTWQADPSQTGLVLVVYGNRTDGPSLLATERGPSPLRVHAEPEGLVPGGTLTWIVWPEGKTPTQPSLFLDVTRQPFRVEGTLTGWDAVWTTSP